MLLGAWSIQVSLLSQKQSNPTTKHVAFRENNSEPAMQYLNISLSRGMIAPVTSLTTSVPDVAILILACNREQETTFALTSWSQVKGIASHPLYVSIDCNPGIHIDSDIWRSKGLSLQVHSSHQRYVTEIGEQAQRRDERVTRHWLHAVSRVLSEHAFVLHAEDDQVVLPEILHNMYTLLTL